jgi:hypothetical protein
MSVLRRDLNDKALPQHIITKYKEYSIIDFSGVNDKKLFPYKNAYEFLKTKLDECPSHMIELMKKVMFLAIKAIQENINHAGKSYFQGDAKYDDALKIESMKNLFEELTKGKYKKDLEEICTPMKGGIKNRKYNFSSLLSWSNTNYTSTADKLRSFIKDFTKAPSTDSILDTYSEADNFLNISSNTDSILTTYSAVGPDGNPTHTLRDRRDLDVHFKKGNKIDSHSCCLEAAILTYAQLTNQPLTKESLHTIRNIGSGMDKTYIYQDCTLQTRISEQLFPNEENVQEALSCVSIKNDEITYVDPDSKVNYDDLINIHGEGIYLVFGNDHVNGNIEKHVECLKIYKEPEIDKLLVDFSGWDQRDYSNPKTKEMVFRTREFDRFKVTSVLEIKAYYYRPLIC